MKPISKTITKKNDIHLIRFKTGPNPRFKQSLLCLSDLHLDNPHTDKKKVKKLLDDAVKEGNSIAIFGDLFDVMGTKFDRRTTKSDIEKSHQEDNYLNIVAHDIAEFLAPYIDSILFISIGNHEKEIDKRMEISLLEIMNLYLHKMVGKEICISNDYAGYIKVIMRAGQKSGSCNIFYNHGKDGNATMSFGVLNVKRNASVIDADIFISGHVHKNYTVPLNRIILTDLGYIKVKEQLHIQLGTSKETHGTDYFSARKGFDPASTSFYYIDFELIRHKNQYKDFSEIKYTERRVKL